MGRNMGTQKASNMEPVACLADLEGLLTVLSYFREKICKAGATSNTSHQLQSRR
jgi:hypothetical protein